MNMGTQAQKTTVNENGEEKDALQITFTNGALAELEDLAKYLKTDDLVEVVRIGIALLNNTRRHTKPKATPQDEEESE